MRKLILTLLALLSMAVPLHAATGTLLPDVKRTYLDNNGNPCNGCQLFFYAAGSSAKQTVFSDVSLATPLANPVVLDSSGRIAAGGPFATVGQSFKLVLAPSTDTDPPSSPIWTQDTVGTVPLSSTSADVDVSGTAGEGLTTGEIVCLSDGSGGLTAGRWYRCDADFTYLSTTTQALGFSNTTVSTGSACSVRRIGRVTGLSALTAGTVYYVSATAGALTAVAPTNVRIAAIADTTTSAMVLPGHAIASSTVPGLVGLLSQTLGSGATTDVKTVGGIAINSTPNYKPGSDTALDVFSCGVFRGSVDTTQRANSGTGNTTMSTFSLPAGTLATNGQYAIFTFGGTLAANANNKTITFVFGSTTLTLLNGAANGGGWHVTVYVVRTGAATQKLIGFITDRPGGSADANAFSTTAAETLANAVTVNTKSQSGTASSDILQEVFVPGVCG